MVNLDPLLTGFSRVVGPLTKTSYYTNKARNFAKNPDDALGKITVASIIIKDGVGCWRYVTQSLNNEKIPEKKRKFVAALDLTNGGLMILAQIGMFLAMRKYSGKIFDKIFKGSFSPQARSLVMTKARSIQDKICTPIARKLNLEKEYNEVNKDGLGIFKFILDTAAATIVGKRVIVPFIATPLASKVEKWMDKKGSKPEKTEIANDAPKKLDVTSSQNTVPVSSTGSIQSSNLLDQYRKNMNK